MPKGRITKRSVDALRCPNGKDRELLWDDALSGFGVVAFPGGKKAYVVQYRQDGKSRRSTIGDHGRLTPDEARSEAKKLLGAVEKGVDPIAARKAEREVRTFEAVATDYLNIHVAAHCKPRTSAEYRRILESLIPDRIRSKRVTDLRRSDMARLHGELVAKPYAANMTLAIVSAIWRWAAARDEVSVTANPTTGIKRYPEPGRERYLTAAELSRLGDALRETALDPFAAAAIRLLILTGARLREILDAKWEYLDFERGLLNLPDSKTGKKPLYLSAAALAVLAELPRIEDNPYIIPGAKTGRPRAGLAKPWAAVCKAAGLVRVRRHDMRHTFASTGAGASMGLPIIGKLLGQTQAATTNRYAHLDADPMRRAADTIGATLSAAMDGGKAGNAVAMSAGKTR